jgi:4a-hydroxytetrahydrobiopterin dehydratase
MPGLPCLIRTAPDVTVNCHNEFMSGETTTRAAASAALEPIGWREILRTLCTSVAVTSLQDGLRVSAVAVATCGSDAEGHLRVDVRADRVELSLQSAQTGAFTDVDLALAPRITAAVAELGFATHPATTHGQVRSVQRLELAIDAMDIPRVLPFWKAVLAYGDEPGAGDGPQDAIVDPVGQGPAMWFQQMDAPRTQRNRIHFDITVPHDEADARVQAALAAGGTLVSDREARAFWVLADPEGNEVCVCTWQDRE